MKSVVVRRVRQGHWTATEGGVQGQGPSMNQAIRDLRDKQAVTQAPYIAGER